MKTFTIKIDRRSFKATEGNSTNQNYVVGLHVQIHKGEINTSFLNTSGDERTAHEQTSGIRNLRSRLNKHTAIVETNSSTEPAHEQTRDIHNLRSRLETLVKSNNTKTVAKPKSKHIFIDKAWRLCKKQEGSKICINDIVMAKLRGYTAWPAIVIEFMNKSTVKVQFFGVSESEKIGFITFKEITQFSNSEQVILAILERKCPKFKKAIQEAEFVSGTPSYASITRVHSKQSTV